MTAKCGFLAVMAVVATLGGGRPAQAQAVTFQQKLNGPRASSEFGRVAVDGSTAVVAAGG